MRSNTNACLVPVDGADFYTVELWLFSTKWRSPEFDGTDLCCEIMAYAQIRWITVVNGPLPCGNWTDLHVARHVLRRLLGK